MYKKFCGASNLVRWMAVTVSSLVLAHMLATTVRSRLKHSRTVNERTESKFQYIQPNSIARMRTSSSAPTPDDDMLEAKFCEKLQREGTQYYQMELNYFNGQLRPTDHVCVATQLTYQRLERLKQLANNWKGKLVRTFFYA